MADSRLGRIYAPDPRDRKYAMRGNRLLALVRKSTYWQAPPASDQGDTSECVGHSWRAFLRAAPMMDRVGRLLPGSTDIYLNAQKVDEWPGPPPPYDGTSVRAGAKYLQDLGLLSGYVWAQTMSDFKTFLLTRGPICVGTDWWTKMFEPARASPSSPDLYLVPEGRVEGGHAYLIVGYSAARDAYRMLNSWGTSWAESGRAWIKAEVMDYLIFQSNGEAASAMEI